MNGKCGFPEKQWYRTRALARVGMADIQHYVEHVKGGTYQTLHPYRCGNHWHLSHYRQGKAVCPVCNQIRPAWFSGTAWIVAAHNDCQAND